MYEHIAVKDHNDEWVALPTPNEDTLGVTLGRPELCMPPFAVDAGPAQGNGDVTDAVIYLRGRILNDFAGSLQPESRVPFVAANADEAAIVRMALEVLADGCSLPDAVQERCPWARDEHEARKTVLSLAERFKFVEDGT